MKLYTQDHQPLTLTAEVGRGGEATVYHVTEYPDLVAKIYHQPTAAHEAKLRAMIANPPESTALAWPTELLYRESGLFVGFLMPKISLTEGGLIFDLYHPTRRRAKYPQATKRWLYQVAVVLVETVAAIHAKGHIIGDINESNIMVNFAPVVPPSGRWSWLRQWWGRPEAGEFMPRVTLVDTDSFQIRGEGGQCYRSLVAKPEYTPPELHGVLLQGVDQTEWHDNFGLAALLFQLLMEGYHPFSGVLAQTESVGRVDLYSLRRGLFPYYPTTQANPPPHAPPFGHLAPELQAAFVRCFVGGHQSPHLRPSASEWLTILQTVLAQLATCSACQRFYSLHLPRCPYCHPEAVTAPIVWPEYPLAPRLIPFQPQAPASSTLSTPQTEVTVDPTGAVVGSYRTLSQAVPMVVAGGRVVLLAGEHRLTSPLMFSQAITLKGQGMETTRIISETRGVVMKVTGALLTMHDVTVFHQGDEAADGVMVNNGQVKLERCAFQGGQRGLLLQQDSTAEVKGCRFEEHQAAGIAVTGHSRVTLSNNLCLDNGAVGISFSEQAQGVVRQNYCLRNDVGINIEEQAAPVLEQNHCAQNRQSGISYWDRAQGEASENECSENGATGIAIGGRAEPTLTRNHCFGNGQSGLAYSSEAAGLAQRNKCVENGAHGIVLLAQAAPTLEANRCTGNQEAGIAYFHRSAGVARGNVCKNNGQDEIVFRERTDPHLPRPLPDLSQLIAQAANGAKVQLEAGTYRLTQTLEIKKSVQLMGAGLDKTVIIGPKVGNVVQVNGVAFTAQGITFQATHEKSHVIFATDTNLTLTECRCCHGDVGVWLWGKSQGLIQQCVIEHNHSSGIWLSDQTILTLMENICRANQGAGIAYSGWAGGIAQQNQCVENLGDGIDVSQQASPILSWNICRANKRAGIAYSGEAGGTARSNQCKGNGREGIVLYGEAKPMLIKNICRANQGAGILYYDEAGGTARGNQCLGNGQDKIQVRGLQVRGWAKPILKDNNPSGYHKS